jgi:NAD(P)-dependent dehydrogenase (short-subunit alcohol dehydrogenase family)
VTVDATVIVTGGTGGLGSAVTRAFLHDGWRVVVPWVVEEELDRVGRHERLELIRADLFDPHASASVAVAAAGRPDAPLLALANLVGGYAIGGLVHETPIEEFDRLLTLNLRPTYLMTQAVVPHLLAAGGGSVVCVGSRAGVHPFPGAAGYATAKAAVVAFAQAVAVEYRQRGVRCNAVLPSVIDTPANRAAQPDADHGRWVPPAEVAEVIRFLAGPGSAPTSGAAIPVYGRA